MKENGTNSSIQWNLSITDTLRPEKQFAMQRFSQFRGCFTYRAIYLVPPKQFVIERFLLLGKFVIRGSTVYDVRSIDSDNVNFTTSTQQASYSTAAVNDFIHSV